MLYGIIIIADRTDVKVVNGVRSTVECATLCHADSKCMSAVYELTKRCLLFSQFQGSHPATSSNRASEGAQLIKGYALVRHINQNKDNQSGHYMFVVGNIE